MHAYQPTSVISSEENIRVTAKAWMVFALTFALMLLDFIDRQIVTSMFPYLKADWQLSDKQLGALISAVSLTVALGTIPVALLADRWGRVRIIVTMALTWSGATMACGAAGNYTTMLVARGAVGLGEAGYAPAGAAILAGIFPRRLHSAIFGAFQGAGAVGTILGVWLGGWLATRWGWKAAFGIVGVPGLVLALCYMWVRDPAQATPARTLTPAYSFWTALKNGLILFKKPIVMWACVGGALQLFTVLSLYSWLPSFIHRSYGVSPEKAGAQAAIVILLGALGTVAWGYAVDRFGQGNSGRRLRVVAIGSLLSGGFLMAAFGLLPVGQSQWLCLMLGGFCMTCSIGAVPAVVMENAEPGLRATSLALVAMAQNLFGQSLGPFTTGALSDTLGLERALSIAAAFAFLAAATFAWAGVAHLRSRQAI
ncbi:Sialic acid transporter NanT [Cupriavidus laharis]|uniref:Sialic acid transporter NanT n=1 Tax=Cupriavidus laharis TaxID=151654 RepID=A0ABM8XVL8_9BURK|nr:MFS transporter [Cupriavidus laharis]CAG9184450.1 Sialic acid transporter NanT [Cupriavidus laharis]